MKPKNENKYDKSEANNPLKIWSSPKKFCPINKNDISTTRDSYNETLRNEKSKNIAIEKNNDKKNLPNVFVFSKPIE